MEEVYPVYLIGSLKLWESSVWLSLEWCYSLANLWQCHFFIPQDLQTTESKTNFMSLLRLNFDFLHMGRTLWRKKPEEVLVPRVSRLLYSLKTIHCGLSLPEQTIDDIHCRTSGEQEGINLFKCCSFLIISPIQVWCSSASNWSLWIQSQEAQTGHLA